MTVKGSPLGPIVRCTCQLFGMLENSLAEQNDISVGWQGLTCCHSRLLQDILSIRPLPYIPNNRDLTLPRIYLNDDVITSAESAVESTVLCLASKSNVERFSVASDNEAEIVTVCKIERTNKIVVSCHSSLCKSKQGKERDLEFLENSPNICPHLLKLKEHVNIAELLQNKIVEALEAEHIEDHEVQDFLIDQQQEVNKVNNVFKQR